MQRPFSFACFIFVLLLLLTACTIQPIRDTRPPEVAAATQTARAQAMPPLPTVGPEILPTVELPTVTPSPECVVVKANINADGRKLYHVPGMRNYEQVVIDEAKGERTFCGEQAAIDAGWQKAPR